MLRITISVFDILKHVTLIRHSKCSVMFSCLFADSLTQFQCLSVEIIQVQLGKYFC